MIESIFDVVGITRVCPLCGHDRGKKLGHYDIAMFDDCPVDGHFTIVACDQCGFTFHDSMANQEDFNRYYHLNAFNYSASDQSVSYQFPTDETRYDELFNRVQRHLLPESVIMDVGCAKGGVLEHFKKKGYAALYGVDPFPMCVEHIRSQLKLPAEVGTATQLPFKGVQADLIIYSHIIEHVFDLHDLVQEAAAKLNDNGLVYVEVPDASRYGDYANPPFCHIMFEHINHFDQLALAQLFHGHDFKMIDAGEGTNQYVAVWPVVWAIFQKGAPGSEPDPIDTASKLHDYLAWSESHPLMGVLDGLARSNRPVYVWGIWQYAKQLMGMTPLKHCRVTGLVDMDTQKHGRVLNGIPVAPPQSLEQAPDHSAVIIGATNHQDAISESLLQMGYAGKIITLDGEVFAYDVKTRQRVSSSV